MRPADDHHGTTLGGLAMLALALAAAWPDPTLRADPFELSTPDGRRVRLYDDRTWEYLAEEDAAPPLTLALERKLDRPRGCRFGIRLVNRAPYKVVSLVPQVSAYNADDIRTDTVYVSFQGIKPTQDQYEEFEFKGIGCEAIERLQVHGGDRCAMGDLDRFAATGGRCLARVRLAPSDVFPISK